MRESIADYVRQYDAQGEHRTGTAVDEASAEWLIALIAKSGVQPWASPFQFTRLDQLQCQVTIDGTAIEGIIQLDGGLTGSDGVSGSLGPIGSDHSIGVRLPGHSQSDYMEARRNHAHDVILSVTRANPNAADGMALPNAPSFTAPFGPPVIHVGPSNLQIVEESVERSARVTCMATAVRTPGSAINVETTIKGSRSDLPPLIVLTARSGWWHCASERGTGVSAWLQTIQDLAACDRDVHFVATTGHELGHLGLQHVLATLGDDAVASAACWVHIGASIGAAVGSCLWLQASDHDALEVAGAELRNAGTEQDRTRPIGDAPSGEAASVHKRGGRYVSLLSPNGLLRHQGDRWPNAVDLPKTQCLANAIAGLCSSLASAN